MLSKNVSIPFENLFGTAIQILAGWELHRHPILPPAFHSDPTVGAEHDSGYEEHSPPSAPTIDTHFASSSYKHALSVELQNSINIIVECVIEAASDKKLPAETVYFRQALNKPRISHDTKAFYTQIYEFATAHKQKQYANLSCARRHETTFNVALFVLIQELRAHNVTHIRFGTTHRVNIQGIRSPEDLCAAFTDTEILSHQHDRKSRKASGPRHPPSFAPY